MAESSRHPQASLAHPAADAGRSATYRFGFDIGGTFTDFVLIDTQTGQITSYKTLTTPHDPSQAVVEGWRKLLGDAQVTGSAVETAIHGTTLITNALIERKGAKAALITTRGFRDILEMAKEMRYDIYDLLLVLPEPLVPRPLRLEVTERMNGRGEVVEPLALPDLEALKPILEAHGAQAIAVCFLHSFTNPRHEQQTLAWLQENLPGVSVSISSEVAPEIREYERMSTTVCNAYVQPLTDSYLRRLFRDLVDNGFGRQLYLMLSSGGITTLDTAARFPVRLIESGPAAGVLAATFYGEKLGEHGPRLLRHGRHHRQDVRHPRRPARHERRLRGGPRPSLQARERAAGARAHHRAHRDRRRRRQHRPHRRAAAAQSRPGLVWGRPRAGMLRSRRHGAHGHRRRPRVGVSEPGLLPRGQDESGPRGGRTRRSAPWPSPWG